jgi:hypothetical protein
MIDHVYISVTDVGKSLAFYREALRPSPELDRASGCASAISVRRASTSASSATRKKPLTPPTPPRSTPVALTRAGQQTGHTSPPAITLRMSLISMATA